MQHCRKSVTTIKEVTQFAKLNMTAIVYVQHSMYNQKDPIAWVYFYTITKAGAEE